MSTSRGTHHPFGLALAGLVVGVFFFGTFWYLNQTANAADRRTQINHSMAELQAGLSSLQEAELGVQRILLAGRLDQTANMDKPLNEVRRFRSLLPGIQQTAPPPSPVSDELTALLDAKIQDLDQTVKLANSGRKPEAIALMDARLANANKDPLTSSIQDLMNRFQRQRDAESSTQAVDRKKLWWALSLFGGLSFLALALYFRALANSLKQQVSNARALAASESKLQLMMDGIRDHAIILLDSKGLVQTWNAGAERIKGYAAHEIIGQSFSRFYPPDAQAEGVPERILDAARASGRVEDENWRVRKDGSPFWANVVIHALQNDQGTLIGFVKVTRDLTERRRIEEELRVSERRFRALAESAPVGIYEFNFVRGEIYANDEHFRLTGVPREEASRERFQASVHPEDAPRVLAEVAADMREGRTFDLTYRLRHPDGTVLWVESRGAPIEETSAHGASYLIVSQDITERLATEEGLRSSERRFRALAESASDAIISADSEGRIAYWNPGAEVIFGHKAQDMTGQPLSLIIPDKHRAAHTAGMARYLATGEAHVIGRMVELEGLHKDGHVFPLELSLSAWDQGGDRHFTALIRDITVRKAAEEKLLSLNKELEAFAYSVSHDLRAPLRHIDGFVGLLRRSLGEEIGGRAKHQMEVISGSARQMGTLIDDLLTFSRMGRAEVHKTDFDLGALVRRIINELAPDTAGRDITWRVGPLPSVHGDPALLRLALLNLMGNAVKFTRGRSGAFIEISARLDPSATTVTIRDNGAGFDMRYADKLFGVFQRLHRQEEFEGTGIGLANVARIIHKHDGAVSAEGIPDKGASFTFTLPTPKEHP